MSLRIVVADDHTIVQEGLRALLSTVDGYDLIEITSTGEEAVRAVVIQRPDVVVMDIQMPGIGGIEATRQITKSAPDVAILMLTMFEDDESVFAAMRAGALGYVLKGASPDTMIRAIAAVADGEAIFSAGVARRALTYLTNHRSNEPPFPQLTAREREVLELIADGLSNSAIATRLTLAPSTVSNHISSILAKLQVATRAEAIVRARDAGL
jgi:DNA-binding NarL/FixJ family response regulator